ncbi:hypothetical protein SAMN04487948_105268 [Halogranum amylolyticum]|uniref:DUF7511 domain-containing protein n=1 Tax=Halogranum amylolyticum TaxID=660520 RepID=A0A1H8SQX1_9EURY|nr:hypothetical protein [Halogranum amylolyticum]SEO80977.1 hypothetical protein SAMN04487948_105268 [Halogranum amylolyticum]
MSGADTEFTRAGRRTETRTGREFDLHSVVVSYEDGPDECTIYPRRLGCYERTATWLTANVDCFVDLADAR